MQNHIITKPTFKFLKDLAKNNNRNWFEAHRPVYEKSLQNMVAFADRLIIEMNKHDDIEETFGKKSLFRIYKDVRFSKDKSPYNPRFAIGLQRSSKLRRGGYYLNIKPGNSYLSSGFFGPNPEDLKRIRLDMNMNYDRWKKLLRTKAIKENFGELLGEKVLTAPKGFSIDNPAIELLRYKQFYFRHYFTDEDVLQENFVKEVSRLFRSVRPYLNYMSEVLTTDLNGELIVLFT